MTEGDNPASRITENVLRGFLSDGPIAPATAGAATMGAVSSTVPTEGAVHGD
jgi:hypothetical protein